MKSNCVNCNMVKNALRGLGLPFESRNVADEERKKELIDKTGKDIVPYFIDEEHKRALLGAQEIIQYIRDTYNEKESRPWSSV